MFNPEHPRSQGRYLICGGLPEVVATYLTLRDTRVAAFQAVRSLQKELIESYLDDIAKHSGKLKAVRIASVFRNIPEQLARETNGIRKFIFKDELPGKSTYQRTRKQSPLLDEKTVADRSANIKFKIQTVGW